MRKHVSLAEGRAPYCAGVLRFLAMLFVASIFVSCGSITASISKPPTEPVAPSQPTAPTTSITSSAVANAAAAAALAPDIPELARIAASPQAASFTPSQRTKVEQTLANYTSLESPAPQYRNDQPDPRITRVTASLLSAAAKDPVRNLPTLTQSLLAGEKDPFMRVKLIHDWIAETITYDVSMLTKSTVTGQDLATVLTTRRAVCSGYARLFETMARQAGFEVKTIEGHARGLGSTFAFDQRNSHAWNMVRIGDLWYLVDVTFDAGAFLNGTYQKRYRTDYLFPPPLQLRYSHFPENPAWQLFPTPLDRSGFLSRAMIQAAFFRYGLRIPASGSASGVSKSAMSASQAVPDIPAIWKAAGMLTLEIEAPGGILVDGSVADTKGREIESSVLASQPAPSRWRLVFAMPAAATFTATVFAGRGAPATAASATAPAKLESVLQFTIDNTKAWPANPPVPKVYGRYHNPPGELLDSPITGVLTSGEIVHFAYHSTARHVALIHDQEFTPLTKAQGDLFTLDFKVPRASVLKLGVSENGVDYQIVLAWQVR